MVREIIGMASRFEIEGRFTILPAIVTAFRRCQVVLLSRPGMLIA
jgi:hypothetical protein